MVFNIEIVKKWFSKYEKYLFSYKNGYFVLPHLANSPIALIESLSHMPFTRHDSLKQTISCNNLFVSGKIHYQEIEKNIFLFVTSIEYKKNVKFKAIFDENHLNEFYTFHFIDNNIKNSGHNLNYNGTSYSNSIWMLIKPNHWADATCDKGTNCSHVDIFVSKEWIEENLYIKGIPISKKFDDFLHSDKKCLIWPELKPNSSEHILPFLQSINKQTLDGNSNFLELKCETYKLIDKMLKSLNNVDTDESINYKENTDDTNLIHAEKILSDNILSSFIGIEKLSRDVGMSTTKLKQQFKQKYGMSIYQYFQYKQMQYAFQAFKSNSYQVKVIANLLGYKNVSKFSTAFKKHYKILPSDLLKSK